MLQSIQARREYQNEASESGFEFEKYRLEAQRYLPKTAAQYQQDSKHGRDPYSHPLFNCAIAVCVAVAALMTYLSYRGFI